MESETWGWILLGIAIGYLLGNRQYEKLKINRDPITTLKIPVTRLKYITTNTLSDYDPDTNTSTVKNAIYEMIHYDGNGNQVIPSQITTFHSSNSAIFLDTNNISWIHVEAPVGTYSVYIKFQDSFGLTYQGTFGIKVIS